jgi:diacylglycerol kinase
VWKVLSVTFMLCTAHLFEQQNTWSLWEHREHAPFFNWDGQQYLHLARHGYPDTLSAQHAFYPLFPITIRALSFGNCITGTFLATTLLGYVFCLLLYCYSGSVRTVVLTLCFPTAFFLNAAYTEGLFMVGLFGMLFLWERHLWWCILPAALLPLIRGQSYFVLAALLPLLLIEWWQKKEYRYTAATICAILGGIGALQLFYWKTTGDPFAYQSAQSFFFTSASARNSIVNLWDIPRIIGYLSKPSHLFSFENSLNDKVCIMAMFACMALVLRSRKTAGILLYGSLVLFPALMGEGVSYTRHAFIAFPSLADSIPARYRIPVAVCMVPIQLYLLWRFSINAWVG